VIAVSANLAVEALAVVPLSEELPPPPPVPWKDADAGVGPVAVEPH
jgi:hypothetical protein